MNNIKSYSPFLLSALLFSACATNQPRYGTWLNETRFEVGLERLPEWYSFYDDHWKNMEYWNNDYCFDTIFSLVQICTYFNADTILWEEDIYYSGTVYKTVDVDRQPEELVRRYHFDTHEWEYEWTTRIGESQGFTIVSTKNISKEEADSLMGEWTFPNYLFNPPCEEGFCTGNLIFVTPDTHYYDRPNHVVITECTDSGVYVYDARPGQPVRCVPLDTFFVDIWADTTISLLNFVRFMAIDPLFDIKYLKQQLQSSLGQTMDACALVRRCFRGPKGQKMFTAKDPLELYHSPMIWGPFRIE